MFDSIWQRLIQNFFLILIAKSFVNLENFILILILKTLFFNKNVFLKKERFFYEIEKGSKFDAECKEDTRLPPWYFPPSNFVKDWF